VIDLAKVEVDHVSPDTKRVWRAAACNLFGALSKLSFALPSLSCAGNECFDPALKQAAQSTSLLNASR